MAASSRSLPAKRLAFGAPARDLAVAVPVEVPVNIVYGDIPYAVMMATPADLEDFARGFSLTEGIIDKADEIRSIAVEETSKGMVASVILTPGRFRAHLARGRNLAGRTGCGVCGVETLDDLPQARPAPGEPPPLAAAAIARALSALERHQPLNDLTRAVHAAAWCDNDGNLREVREDVGRHNALDKLIGALLARNTDAADGFVLITSRCSFEMVEKAARFGARWLVAISAPTSLALERASALGLGIVAIARGDAVTVFNGTLSALDAKGAA